MPLGHGFVRGKPPWNEFQDERDLWGHRRNLQVDLHGYLDDLWSRIAVDDIKLRIAQQNAPPSVVVNEQTVLDMLKLYGYYAFKKEKDDIDRAKENINYSGSN